MKAAIVAGAEQAPDYGDFAAPIPMGGEALVRVTASAISQVTRSRASGAHYSADGLFPFVPGIDGVGRLEDGRRVYFVMPRAPFGGMAERTVVDTRRCVPLPDELDDVTAAALANAGLSSWAALSERARLVRGESVLVNGATGRAGRLAVQIAKHLGAGKVIATGRNAAALSELTAMGADVTLSLTDDRAFDEAAEGLFAQGVDLVLDYLWGRSAERLLIAAARAGAEALPIRYVQIGAASGGEIALPGAVLRSSAITLMGSGVGSIPMDRLLAATEGVLRAAAPAGLKIATRARMLAEVAEAWSETGAELTVVTMS